MFCRFIDSLKKHVCVPEESIIENYFTKCSNAESIGTLWLDKTQVILTVLVTVPLLRRDTMTMEIHVKKNIKLSWQITISEVWSIFTMMGRMTAYREAWCWRNS